MNQEKIFAVHQMQEYIHNHIYDEITLSDLAKACAYSPWHARRIFCEGLGTTPAEYIRRLRLSKSALKLRDEDCKILDLAMEMGFGSVDGYQRAFRREFGCNPKEYALSKPPLWLFTPYLIEIKRKRRDEKMSTRNIFIQVIKKPERKVILKRGIKANDYWSYCREVGCDVWGLLTSIQSLGGEPVSMWLPEKYRNPITNEYVQGVEVDLDYPGEVPEGFEVITLPKAEYLLFRGEPFKEEDYEQAIQEIWEAEKKYDPSFVGYAWDNTNPRIQLEPVGERGYIELLPVREI